MTTNEAVPLLIQLAKRTHYSCEDSWYSCPLAPGGCADDSLPKDECSCGADEHNARIAEIEANLVIPATERVDVERVRAVIAEMDEHVNDGCKPHWNLVAEWKAKLTAAIGDKT